MTLAEIAELIGGRVEGNETLRIDGIAPVDQASETELGFFASPRYRDRAAHSRAGAILVSAELESTVGDRSRVVVEDAHKALSLLLPRLYPPPEASTGIHATAVIGQDVRLGVEVAIGPYVVIGAGTHLGNRTRVGAHSVIGSGCRLGDEVVLHPQVTLYPGTVLGDRVIVHSGTRIGVDGYGYVTTDEGHEKVPQVGKCTVEDDVEIGANVCIDRGSIGHTRVGKGTKIDNLVHLAHNVTVGAASLLVAQVGVAGSTRLGDGVVLGGQAGVIGHIEIGDGARIGAQAGVIGGIPAGETVVGFPARPRTEYLRGMREVLRLPDLVKRVAALEAKLDSKGGAT